MKKFSITLISLLTILFSGCINLEIETFIGGDGSGSAIIHYWTNLEILYNDTSSSNNFSFNKDVIRKNFGADNIEIKSIKVWENKSDSTFHTEVKIVFDDITKLNECIFFKDYQIRFFDGAQGQKIFEQRIRNFNLNFPGQNEYYVKYIYHFPGTIITDNATEKRNNTLIWKFSLDQLRDEKTLSVTFKVPISSGLSYVITISILILIALWLILILRKRKKRLDE